MTIVGMKREISEMVDQVEIVEEWRNYYEVVVVCEERLRLLSE